MRIYYKKLANDYDKIQEKDKWLLNFGLINIIQKDCQKKLEESTKFIIETRDLMEKIREKKDVEIL